MSHFALVPDNAIGDEHLTFVWCGKPKVDRPRVMGFLADCVTEHCPVEGVVFALSMLGQNEDIPVAEVALPHDIHLLRAWLSNHDRSEFTWRPHVTIVEGRTFEVGDRITFVRCEWRS